MLPLSTTSISHRCWYFCKQDRTLDGPHTEQELSIALKTGRIKKSTMVWNGETMSEWKELRKVTGLLMRLERRGSSDHSVRRRIQMADRVSEVKARSTDEESKRSDSDADECTDTYHIDSDDEKAPVFRPRPITAPMVIRARSAAYSTRGSQQTHRRLPFQSQIPRPPISPVLSPLSKPIHAKIPISSALVKSHTAMVSHMPLELGPTISVGEIAGTLSEDDCSPSMLVQAPTDSSTGSLVMSTADSTGTVKTKKSVTFGDSSFWETSSQLAGAGLDAAETMSVVSRSDSHSSTVPPTTHLQSISMKHFKSETLDLGPEMDDLDNETNPSRSMERTTTNQSNDSSSMGFGLRASPSRSAVTLAAPLTATSASLSVTIPAAFVAPSKDEQHFGLFELGEEDEDDDDDVISSPSAESCGLDFLDSPTRVVEIKRPQIRLSSTSLTLTAESELA